MSDFSVYQLALIGLTLAGVLLARDSIRYIVGLKVRADTLAAENKELKARVTELSKSREEIIEGAYETFSRRLDINRPLLERLALRQLIDLIWQCNPKAVKEVFEQFVRESKVN